MAERSEVIRYEQRNIGKDSSGNPKWKGKYGSEESAWDAIYGNTSAGGGGRKKNDTSTYFGAGSDNPNADEPTERQVSQRVSKPNINDKINQYPGSITDDEIASNKENRKRMSLSKNDNFSNKIRKIFDGAELL